MDLLLIICRQMLQKCVSFGNIFLWLFYNFFLCTALVHPDNNLSHFLTYSNADTWCVIEVNSSHNDNGDGAGDVTEYLLVFQTLAIYVDQLGRKTRDREIMYPAVPTFISKFYNNSYLVFA